MAREGVLPILAGGDPLVALKGHSGERLDDLSGAQHPKPPIRYASGD